MCNKTRNQKGETVGERKWRRSKKRSGEEREEEKKKKKEEERRRRRTTRTRTRTRRRKKKKEEEKEERRRRKRAKENLENDAATAILDQDVGALHVTMHNVLLVQIVEAQQNLAGEVFDDAFEQTRVLSCAEKYVSVAWKGGNQPSIKIAIDSRRKPANHEIAIKLRPTNGVSLEWKRGGQPSMKSQSNHDQGCER